MSETPAKTTIDKFVTPKLEVSAAINENKITKYIESLTNSLTKLKLGDKKEKIAKTTKKIKKYLLFLLKNYKSALSLNTAEKTDIKKQTRENLITALNTFRTEFSGILRKVIKKKTVKDNENIILEEKNEITPTEKIEIQIKILNLERKILQKKSNLARIALANAKYDQIDLLPNNWESPANLNKYQEWENIADKLGKGPALLKQKYPSLIGDTEIYAMRQMIGLLDTNNYIQIKKPDIKAKTYAWGKKEGFETVIKVLSTVWNKISNSKKQNPQDLLKKYFKIGSKLKKQGITDIFVLKDKLLTLFQGLKQQNVFTSAELKNKLSNVKDLLQEYSNMIAKNDQAFTGDRALMKNNKINPAGLLNYLLGTKPATIAASIAQFGVYLKTQDQLAKVADKINALKEKKTKAKEAQQSKNSAKIKQVAQAKIDQLKEAIQTSNKKIKTLKKQLKTNPKPKDKAKVKAEIKKEQEKIKKLKQKQIKAKALLKKEKLIASIRKLRQKKKAQMSYRQEIIGLDKKNQLLSIPKIELKNILTPKKSLRDAFTQAINTKYKNRDDKFKIAYVDHLMKKNEYLIPILKTNAVLKTLNISLQKGVLTFKKLETSALDDIIKKSTEKAPEKGIWQFILKLIGPFLIKLFGKNSAWTKDILKSFIGGDKSNENSNVDKLINTAKYQINFEKTIQQDLKCPNLGFKFSGEKPIVAKFLENRGQKQPTPYFKSIAQKSKPILNILNSKPALKGYDLSLADMMYFANQTKKESEFKKYLPHIQTPEELSNALQLLHMGAEITNKNSEIAPYEKGLSQYSLSELIGFMKKTTRLRNLKKINPTKISKHLAKESILFQSEFKNVTNAKSFSNYLDALVRHDLPEQIENSLSKIYVHHMFANNMKKLTVANYKIINTLPRLIQQKCYTQINRQLTIFEIKPDTLHSQKQAITIKKDNNNKEYLSIKLKDKEIKISELLTKKT